ncbi:MAG: mechanosensitive ion channel family protein [Candidatus Thorarchaeota archaeon]
MATGDQTLVEAIKAWFLANYVNLIVAVIIVIIGIVLLIVIRRQIKRLERKQRVTAQYSKLIIRISRWLIILILIVSVLLLFNVTVGAVTGVIALFGGTILGFAAINTIGNGIAGIIVMSSKPFHVGDRILYKGTIADVEEVELMYTKMRTLDNALIVVPNQELLKIEIINYAKEEPIRKSIKTTFDYKDDAELIKKVLIFATEDIENIDHENEPYVRITDFQNFALEYTLYYYVTTSKSLYTVDAIVRQNITKLTEKHKLDMRTPLLSKNMNPKE